MKHGIGGRQLQRSSNERRRLFQGLLRDLFIHGSIKTTMAKAKSVRSQAEKLITKAKKSEDYQRRKIYEVLSDKKSTSILWEEGKTRFSARTSGFTRIVHIGPRRGDNAEEVVLSFVDARPVKEVKKVEKTEVQKKVSTKKAVVLKEKAPKKTTKKE